jgi:hypothetical protein
MGTEYKEMGGDRNSHRPTTIALGSLINSNANVMLLQPSAKYYTVKV